jgi:uncharacterized spore protein YtfJ
MDVDALMARAQESLTAGRSFGPIVERDGATIIPAALVVGGGGGGSGESPEGSANPGKGGGGGYFSLSWPLGAYVVKDGTARWVPAVDATRIAIAALAAIRLGMKLRASRRFAPR